MQTIVCFTLLVVLACVDAQANYLLRNRRQAIGDGEDLWPNKKVFFQFDSTANSNARKAFLAAVDFWKANTCVDFEESSTAPNRIRVFDGGAGQCYSYVGVLPPRFQPQNLSLGNGCETFRAAAHEIAHALGFEHLQNRKDRDEFVTIDDGYKGNPNYGIASSNENYGLPFDFGSIMMYLGFSTLYTNGATKLVDRAIKPKDRRYTLTAGSTIVSFYDVLMMNKRYTCEENCPTGKSATCKNTGYPHPRDCSKCVCPLGYQGDCTEYAQGTVVYNTEKNNSAIVFADNKTDSKSSTFDAIPNYRFYQIEAPEGKRVELTLDHIKGDADFICSEHGIEVRTKKDKALTGYRFCDELQLIDENTVKVTDSNDPNKVALKFTSESNTMSVYVYEFTQFDSFGLKFRSID